MTDGGGESGNGTGERHYTTYVHAEAEAVWERLTTADEQARWYMPATEWDLQEGGALAWGSQSQAFVRATVTALRPRVGYLAHSFAFSFLQEPPGLVRWRVTQMGEVSQVWLRHELGGRPGTNDIVGGSWPVMLARLKSLVETGTPMPEPVWPTTEGWDADPA